MRYSIGAGPVRFYGGGRKFTQTASQACITAVIFIPLWIAFIVWLGFEGGALMVVSALFASLFVLIKVLASIKT